MCFPWYHTNDKFLSREDLQLWVNTCTWTIYLSLNWISLCPSGATGGSLVRNLCFDRAPVVQYSLQMFILTVHGITMWVRKLLRLGLAYISRMHNFNSPVYLTYFLPFCLMNAGLTEESLIGEDAPFASSREGPKLRFFSKNLIQSSSLVSGSWNSK